MNIDAIYCANMDMATGAYHVIKERGISIPRDLGFVMFDDPDWTTLVDPMITAVRQPVYAMGYKAAELVFERIYGKLEEPRKMRTVRLEAQIIRRGSV